MGCALIGIKLVRTCVDAEPESACKKNGEACSGKGMVPPFDKLTCRRTGCQQHRGWLMGA